MKMSEVRTWDDLQELDDHDRELLSNTSVSLLHVLDLTLRVEAMFQALARLIVRTT